MERLKLAARDRHAAAAQRHRTEMAAWKEAGSDPAAKPVPPRLDRYLVEGTTIEALSEVLRDDEEARHRVPTGRVLVRQDEMSEWIAGFDRYRSGGRGGGDRGAYLRLYNGGSYVVDRVGRGSFAVPNWSACVLGGIQPEPIQRIARDAADDGLLQRFLYCVPARQGMGQDRQPDRAAIARYEALIATLVALRPEQAQPTEPAARRRALVLAEAAHRHREEVEGLVRAMAALPGTSSRLKAALGKWSGLFARLGLLFHLVEAAAAVGLGQPVPRPGETVTEQTARRVAALLREVLLPHLLRAEAMMFASTRDRPCTLDRRVHPVAGRGAHHPARDVVQAYGPLRSPESRRKLLEVMESLVSMAWLQPGTTEQSGAAGGGLVRQPGRSHHLCRAGRGGARADRQVARDAVAATLRRKTGSIG
ncbi:DUF3987 domain-containing protein [Dankookia sp. P2]|uniref:DUF3987 domain-containing protein n=1 Tax=Dankookia sp. P2 TaxID=3423955 RepID=UPI003D672A21